MSPPDKRNLSIRTPPDYPQTPPCCRLLRAQQARLSRTRGSRGRAQRTLLFNYRCILVWGRYTAMLSSWAVVAALLPVATIAAPSSQASFVTSHGTSTYLEQLDTKASNNRCPVGRSFAQRSPCEVNRLCRRCSTTVEPCVTTEEGDEHHAVSSSSSRRPRLPAGAPCLSTEARDEHDSVNRSRRLRSLPGTLPIFLATATTTVLGSQPSMAAVTGGRIGGGYNVPEQNPSAPPIQRQQQQPYRPQQYGPPRAGRDILGSDGSRVHINFSGSGGRRRGNRARFNPDVGDVTSSSVTPGTYELRTRLALCLRWYI